MLRPTQDLGVILSLPIIPSKLYPNYFLLLKDGNQEEYSLSTTGEKQRSGDNIAQLHSRATIKFRWGRIKP